MAYGRKNFASTSPVKWFMSFVKTSSLRSVGIRKIGREYFYYLEVDKPSVLCTVPSLTSTSCTYNAHAHNYGPNTKSSLECLFWKGKFFCSDENFARHLYKAHLSSNLGFVLWLLILGCLISALTRLCFFHISKLISAHAPISVLPRISTHPLMIF